MGSLYKNNKRRRKFLDILKYTDDLEEDEKVQLPVSDTSSDELINDIEQLIDEEMCEYSTNSEFSCTFCSKEFKSKRDVKSHMKVHFQDRPYICSSTACEKTFKTSSNLRRHERICTNTKNVSKEPKQTESFPGDIYDGDDPTEVLWDNDLFEKILSEDTNLPIEEGVLSVPPIDDYNDMLENLIASASPDELNLKNSISNEIPDNLEDVTFANCKRKLSETDLERDDEEEGTKQQRKGEVEKDVPHVTNERQSYKNNTKQENIYEHRNKEKNLDFENLVNEKIFNVLNPNVKRFKEYNFKTNKIAFSVTMPDLPITREKVLHKGFNLGMGVKTAKNDVSNRLLDVKRLTKKSTTNKRSKRGSLGWQLKREMEQYDEIENDTDEDTGCERLNNLDDDTHNGSYYKHQTNKKSTSYNGAILEDIYANTSKTKQFIKQSEKSRNQTLKLKGKDESKRDKTDQFHRRKCVETCSPESSQESPIYSMPVLDFL
eukprot:TRINITY_DN4429_c0_g1_i1.p1 TRINITY_DN4429_c0_g1~~TRINITY_DN4429_c0_g1_i1.p1  ORF type:complete len:489 (-),score=139.16 TRINITY_DN4429_c0_g1_i1:66-1532(-)